MIVAWKEKKKEIPRNNMCPQYSPLFFFPFVDDGIVIAI